MKQACRILGMTPGGWLLLPILVTGTSLGQTIPLWYSGGDPSAKALDSQYRRTLHTFDGKDLLLTSSSGTISVKTCDQYLDAIRRGNAAANNYENKKEVVFVETCFTLDYVRQARPSIRSYFKDHVLPSNLLDLLPPVIQIGVAGTELDEGENWRDQDSTLSLTKLSGRRADLEDDTNYYNLSIDLTGDLNGDGVEDLAGFACMTAKGGTLLFCKTFAITRCGPNKPIVLISADVVPYRILNFTTCANAENLSKRPKHP